MHIEQSLVVTDWGDTAVNIYQNIGQNASYMDNKSNRSIFQEITDIRIVHFWGIMANFGAGDWLKKCSTLQSSKVPHSSS